MEFAPLNPRHIKPNRASLCRIPRPRSFGNINAYVSSNNPSHARKIRQPSLCLANLYRNRPLLSHCFHSLREPEFPVAPCLYPRETMRFINEGFFCPGTGGAPHLTQGRHGCILVITLSTLPRL